MEPLSQHRTLILFEGIIFLILGILAIVFPAVFTFGFTLLIGALFFIAGIAQIVRAVQIWNLPGHWMTLAGGILSLIVAYFFFANPLEGVMTLTLLLMFYFFISGLFKIALGLELRPLKNWGWMIASGIIAILMGAIIWSGWPGTAMWVIGLLIGVDMIFFGFALITFASSLRKKEVA